MERQFRPCLEVGCPRVVLRGRCRAHAKAHSRARRLRRLATGSRRVYEDSRWSATRRRALARCGHQCQAVEDGVRCPVRTRLHGHHDYPGGVEQMVADGADPFDEHRVVMLCASHHARVDGSRR